MSIPEQVARLTSVLERIPMGLLSELAESEPMTGIEQADNEMAPLNGEIFAVLDHTGLGTMATGAVSDACAKLAQAREAYGIVRMYLGDARDAAEQARQALTRAVEQHSA
ncbi:hypothetical protein [Amycolatopsis minnesotensis]|uniref:Uncharacterized protein n=1 Tax=Amycolatopsis minnesotensis TaxID=337894 RepID=A0ABN2SGP0_9PSEU